MTDLRAGEYVDLVLLHFPQCTPQLCDGQPAPQGGWLDAWRALESLVLAGAVRSIGARGSGRRAVCVHMCI